MNILKKNMANIMTLSSLFLGFSSILASIQAVNEMFLHSLDKSKIGYPYSDSLFAFAGLSILFCTLFDFLDGYFARKFNVSGDLGKQLDSLTDLISFGLAPGVLFFTITMIVTGYIPESGIFYKTSQFIPEALLPHLVVFKLFAFIFPTCAMIRLANFNIKPSNQNYFEGIPSTFAGGMVAVFLSFNFYITPIGKLIEVFHWEAPSILVSGVNWFEGMFQNYFFLFFTYMLLAFLMVSKVKFIKVKKFIDPYLNRKGIPFLVLHGLALILLFKYYLILLGVSYLLFANSIVMKNHEAFTSSEA